MLFKPVGLSPWWDLSNLEPFSDEEFRSLKAHYEYDRTPLNAVIEETDDSLPYGAKRRSHSTQPMAVNV